MSAPLTSGLSVELLLRVIDVKYGYMYFTKYFTLISPSIEYIQLLRIPTGGRQTSWLFYKCTWNLNQGLPETNSVSNQNGVLNPGSPDLKTQALTTRPHCLLGRLSTGYKTDKSLSIG